MKRSKVALSVSAAGLCIVAVGIVLWQLNDGGSSPHSEFISPAGLGSAVFFTENDSPDPSMSLYVRDYKKSGNALLEVATVDSPAQSIIYFDSHWSGDGSTLFVNFLSSSATSPYGPTVFGAGYDFRSHKKLVGRTAPSVIASRGGVGQAITLSSEKFKRD